MTFPKSQNGKLAPLKFFLVTLSIPGLTSIDFYSRVLHQQMANLMMEWRKVEKWVVS
jgi:hypothetical protein